MEFTQNFTFLMKELEKEFKKVSRYNDYSKFHGMTELRAKATAYRAILRPLVYDHTRQQLNGEVKKFNEQLKTFQENCNKQIKSALGEVI